MLSQNLIEKVLDYYDQVSSVGDTNTVFDVDDAYYTILCSSERVSKGLKFNSYIPGESIEGSRYYTGARD